jgi:hypothetical protein
MKIDIRYLRWIFLGLYVVIVLGLFASAYADFLPIWLFPLHLLTGNLFFTLIFLLVTFGSQALFVFSAGTLDLCRPIRRRRLLAPVIIASLMMTVLVGGASMSLLELFTIDDEGITILIFWALIVVSWVVWSIVLFTRYKEMDRYAAVKGLISTMLAGSLLELLIAVPSHIIVSRRPGCFVGLFTACGITSGIAVMLWSFGPGIVLMFLRKRREKERREEGSGLDS